MFNYSVAFKRISLIIFLVNFGVISCRLNPRGGGSSEAQIDDSSKISERDGQINTPETEDEPVSFNLGANAKYNVEKILQRLALDINNRSLTIEELEGIPTNDIPLNEVPTWIDRIFSTLTWDTERNMPVTAFTDWLVEYHQNIFRVFMPRKANGFDSPIYLDLSLPEVKALNDKYVARFPDRYYNPELGEAPGGRVDVAPSSETYSADLGYYLITIEPALYAAAVVGNNLPYREVVTGGDSVTNEVMEHVMSKRGMTRQPPAIFNTKADLVHWTGDWYFKKARISYANEGSGVLTHPVMLQTYNNPRQWVNRAVYNMWLCQEIRSLEPDENITYMFYKNEATPPLSQPDCAGCHYMLDSISNLRYEYTLVYPLGNDFSAYDGARKNITFDDSVENLKTFNALSNTNWPSLEMDHYLIDSDDKTYIPLQGFHGLGQALADHKWFHSCAAKRLFRHLYRREATTERDELIIQQGVDAYVNHGESFKDMLKAMVSLPDYYILSVTPESEEEETQEEESQEAEGLQ